MSLTASPRADVPAIVDVAVVGVGYLGSRHAEKYAAHPAARLRALVDPDPQAEAVAARLGVPVLADVAELPADVRAVSLAVPTPLHHRLGVRLLESGRDVLVEKPIASTPAEAEDLIRAAEAGGRILQVGHLERFNPAIRRLRGFLREPRFIESHRLAPWNVRGTEVDVVLDLMIHDIDIILNIVRSAPVKIHAAGVPVISGSVDIANARLEFEDGCVANVTASRVSADKMRKIRVFQPDAYVSIDFLRRSAAIVRRVPAREAILDSAAAGEIDREPAAVAAGRVTAGGSGPGLASDGGSGPGPAGAGRFGSGPAGGITREEVSFEGEEADPLALEIDAFLRAVADRGEPPVTGRDGMRALEVAGRIVELIGE